MASFLCPLIKFRWFDNNGNPLSNGKVYTYYAGTTSPADTWTSADQTSLNTNPVILDAAGAANIFLDSGILYKIVIKNSLGVTQVVTDYVGITGELSSEETEFFSISAQTSTITLNQTPQIGGVNVFLNGILLIEGKDYSIVNKSVVMNQVLVVGDEVVVQYTKSLFANVAQRNQANNIVNTFTTTTATDYTLSQNPGALSNLLVILNGLVLKPVSDYTWSSFLPQVLHLNITPAAGQDLIVNFKDVTPGELLSGPTSDRPAAPVVGVQYYDTTLMKPIWWNGSVWQDAAINTPIGYSRDNIINAFTTTTATDYTLSQNPGALSNLLVILDGLVLTPTTDYTWNAYAPTILHLNNAPTAGQELIVNFRDVVPALSLAGTTSTRPASPSIGAQYYDTTLMKPIWWNGTAWQDAAINTPIGYAADNIVNTFTTSLSANYTLSQNPGAQSNIMVILNGTILTPVADYSWSAVSPTTLTLAFIPPIGQDLIVFYRDVVPALSLAGTTSLRPSTPSLGTQYYDTTLLKPIWFNGTLWKDASGNIV